jgi:hypothetical protein
VATGEKPVIVYLRIGAPPPEPPVALVQYSVGTTCEGFTP